MVWIRGSRARARLNTDAPGDPGTDANFWLRKTPGGWRLDDSDIVPFGH